MKQHLLPIACLTLLTACAGNAVKDSESIQQSAVQQAKAIDQDPQAVITESQNLQIEAQKEDLYFFSPTYMKQAEDALEDAEDAIKAKKQPHEIITFALTAQKLFKRGLENKPTVLVQLKATFDGIQMLRDIDTDKVLASDFQDIQDETKDLIILIEQGNTTEAISEQKDLLKDIAKVEIKTLEKVYLSPAENALEKAEDADAEDYAAKSFAEAEKTIEGFEKFIQASPKQRDAIKEKSKLAIQLAQHAKNIAKAAKPLLKLNPETAEDHVLFIEKLMGRIASALGQDNILHLNLNSQSIAIAQTAETVNKRANTQNQIIGQAAAWDAEKTKLLATIDKLKQAQTENTVNTPTTDTEASTTADDTDTTEEEQTTQTMPPEANTADDNATNQPPQIISEKTPEQQTEPAQPVTDENNAEASAVEKTQTNETPTTTEQTQDAVVEAPAPSETIETTTAASEPPQTITKIEADNTDLDTKNTSTTNETQSAEQTPAN